ncbi:MAG: FmdB family transcriptional regulator [Actinomycetota bacterium]|nr:FmdB family transcriptional regulator [Actinomycetota bacterium]
MPTYEYRCERGHTFEVMQRIADDPVSICTTCSAPVQRVMHPVAVHFKGSGFYNTDYGTRKRAREQKEHAESKSKAESSSGSEKKSGSESSKGGGEAGRSGSDSKGSSDSKAKTPASS